MKKAKGPQFDPRKVRGNFGPGGFPDLYDNGPMKSLDRSGHPGGVTEIPFEDNLDLLTSDFYPHKGEAHEMRLIRHEPDRDADLTTAPAEALRSLRRKPDYSGLGPAGWKLSDEKLRERVSEVLLLSHEVDPSELEVIVEDAVVTLKGKIASRGMKSVAEDLVLSVPGVVDVFTELSIKRAC